MFHNKIYKVDRKAADKMLQNVFASTETKPNSTSFNMILLRTMANTTMIKACRIIATIMLVLVLISPIAFADGRNVNNKISIPTDRVTVLQHHLYEDRFEMILAGDSIDYTGIYCKKLDGSVVIPTKSSEDEHLVVIPFDGDSLNIYITCSDGKVIQALLSR